MGRLKAFITGFGLSALMMAWSGCDSSERIQAPPASRPTFGTTDLSGSSEFDRELIAAKNGTDDPIERVRAMTAILDKYGVDHPPATEFAGMPAAADPAAFAPAAKTASHTWSPIRRDFTSPNGIHTYRGSVSVGNGQSSRFVAMGNADNVDPFLVAYYVDDNPAVSTAYKVRVVGFNDDYTGLNRNSVILWTNNTGGAKTIQFIAFAYSSVSRGKGFITTTVNGTTTSFFDREIGGLKLFGATALPAIPSDCNHPRSTRIKLARPSGSQRGSALVMDAQAMRGGHLDMLANSLASLELPWMVNNPYPSFALVYQPFTGVLPANWALSEVPTQYRFTQTDIYDCVD